MERKAKDANIVKTSTNDPHFRSVVIKNVPKLCFAKVYGSKFFKSEVLEAAENAQSPRFGSLYIDRVRSFIPDIVRYHKSGDISIITPWFSLKEDQVIACNFGLDSGSSEFVFPKGKLLLPLNP